MSILLINSNKPPTISKPIFVYHYNMFKIFTRDEDTEIINKRNKILMSNIQYYLDQNIITSSIINDPFFKKICNEHHFIIKPFNIDILDVYIPISVIMSYDENENIMKCIKVDINYIGFYKITMLPNYKLELCKCNNKNVISIQYNNKTIYGGDYYNLIDLQSKNGFKHIPNCNEIIFNYFTNCESE